MKINYYILILLSLFAVSCSNDDDNNNEENPNPEPTPVTEDFLPPTAGNYWVYDVESTSANGRDSLYVANDTIINGNTYKKFKTQNPPVGFYSNALNNNGVRNANGKLMISGIPDLGIPNLPFDIQLTDFIIFDQNAINGAQLSSVSGSIPQQIEGFNVSIDYVLTSKAGPTLYTYSYNNSINYENVKQTEITLNLKVTVTSPDFPFPFVLLPAQNVAVSTQYYAEGIGMVHTLTDLSYQLASLPIEMPLPIPESMSEHQEEILSGYQAQ